jgi:tRNA-dihydrouridine synthase B
MRIGNLLLKNNVSLAPMAGITNLPFRTLLKDFGCALTFTEMISANGLTRNSARSFEYLCSTPVDKPLSVQLFGSDPVVLAEAAKIVAGQGADLIDINMGCPAKKIVRTGAGSALLKNPLQVANIIKAVRMAVSLPLTVKIRSGCNARETNAREVACIAEDCGADAVIVHPRTADQGFGGRADWDIIKEVKQAIKIPVVGNGDIRQAADALGMMRHTGCDGVMVGRGALGNPWLIGEIISCLAGHDLPAYPSLPERGKIITRHLEMELQYYGEACGSRNFRKHLLWYTKGLPGGAKFRKLAVNLRGKEAILYELQRFFLSCPDERLKKI